MEQATMDRILDKLEEVYHDDACGLDFGTPFELLSLIHIPEPTRH